ncbi:hypothetical protein HPB47_022177 [Ixodes persulcatus]|uniref:Uncharacterized protein n=1 Tax=Ixodes persulcatus TaxID=34615 RepID=A0AC60QCQ3_IXOPE|nr:hypothetical protein HPB47_022177 [Ixodes persulcatus]
MGRRIPKSSRHKKLKSVDPFRKDAGVEKPIDKRANRPPKSLEQEVPKSLTMLFGDAEDERRPKKRKKKQNLVQVKRSKLEQEQHGMTRPLKKLPETIQQQRHESDEQFLRRLDRLAGRAFSEASVEQKYDVRVTQDDEGRTVVDPKGGGGEQVASNYGARKRAKRKLREQKLKEKKRQKAAVPAGDFSHLKDEVAFGEVAHRPPEISATIRKADAEKLHKHGAKELLLKDLLPKKKESDVMGHASKKADLTVKRKELSAGDRRKLEAERQRAVFLYRKMKAQAALSRASV